MRRDSAPRTIRRLALVLVVAVTAFVPRGIASADPVESAVKAGLEWLARHQSPDGHWDSDSFEAACHDLCGGAGHPLYDQGVTGLALLAFVESRAAAADPAQALPVRRGLDWLLSVQDAEGCFTSRVAHNFTYSHAIATLAVARALATTGDPALRAPLERAVRFIERCRNPYKGWRYGVSPGDNDTSVTGWMVSALAAARDAGIAIDLRVIENSQSFIDEMTDASGKVGYTSRGSGPVRTDGAQATFPPDQSESLTAEGLAASIAMGRKPDHPAAARQKARVLRKPPRWDVGAGTIDLYYWYYGSLSLARSGGDPDGAWVAALHAALLPTQRKEGDRAGSWDPIDAWGETGGRIYSTTMATLALAHSSAIETGADGDSGKMAPSGAAGTTEEILNRLEKLERENAALRKKLDAMKKVLEEDGGDGARRDRR
jgi:hypothetical protein